MTSLEQAKKLIEEAWKLPDLWEGNYDAAQGLLQGAVNAAPRDPAPLICLGAVLSDRGQHAAAIPLLEKAIAFGSSDQNAYMNLAIALMNSGPQGRERAELLFKKARALAPSPITWQAYFDAQAT